MRENRERFMVYFSVFVLFVFFAVQEIDRVFVINLTAKGAKTANKKRSVPSRFSPLTEVFLSSLDLRRRLPSLLRGFLLFRERLLSKTECPQ